MKTHNGYGFLDVPEGAGDFILSNSGYTLYYKIKNSDFLEDEYNYGNINLPPGQWSILGLAKDLGEQDWKGIVKDFCSDSVSTNGSKKHWTMYWNYKTDTYDENIKSFTASGLSLLKSLGLKDNVLILKQQ